MKKPWSSLFHAESPHISIWKTLLTAMLTSTLHIYVRVNYIFHDDLELNRIKSRVCASFSALSLLFAINFPEAYEYM